MKLVVSVLKRRCQQTLIVSKIIFTRYVSSVSKNRDESLRATDDKIDLVTLCFTDLGKLSLFVVVQF